MSAGISPVDDGGKVGALDAQIEQLTVGVGRKLVGDLGALAPLGTPRGERGQERLQQVQKRCLRGVGSAAGKSCHRAKFLLLNGPCAAWQHFAALQHLGRGMVDTASCPPVFSHGSHVLSRQHTAWIGNVDAILGRPVPPEAWLDAILMILWYGRLKAASRPKWVKPRAAGRGDVRIDSAGSFFPSVP